MAHWALLGSASPSPFSALPCSPIHHLSQFSNSSASPFRPWLSPQLTQSLISCVRFPLCIWPTWALGPPSSRLALTLTQTSLHKTSGRETGPPARRPPWPHCVEGAPPCPCQAPGQKTSWCPGEWEAQPRGTDPASLAQCLSPVSLPVSVFSSRAEPLAPPAGCSSGFSPRLLLPAAPIQPTHGTNNKPGATSTCCCVSLGWEGGEGR